MAKKRKKKKKYPHKKTTIPSAAGASLLSLDRAHRVTAISPGGVKMVARPWQLGPTTLPHPPPPTVQLTTLQLSGPPPPPTGG